MHKGLSQDLTRNGLTAGATLPIFVGPRDPTDTSPPGTPPYTMYAFEVDGTPTTQVIGSDRSSLFWTVDHCPGEYTYSHNVASRDRLSTSLRHTSDVDSTGRQ